MEQDTITQPYEVHYLGQEKQPVIIIDDFSTQFEDLRRNAARQIFGDAGRFYPGVRAPASPGYLAEKQGLLEDVIKRVFDIPQGVFITESSYSIVTTPPEALKPIQRFPHYDGVDEGRLAFLHYLSEIDYGGTSFYRHRETGWETITEDRVDTYAETLRRDVEKHGLPEKSYCAEDTKIFERILEVPHKPNRAILYRGITLHSGNLNPNTALSYDPIMGRLTVNIFMSSKASRVSSSIMANI